MSDYQIVTTAQAVVCFRQTVDGQALIHEILHCAIELNRYPR
jgi:hypothetical protein